ncbi:MAG: hypothetical protein Crog4KO_01720 [Crocinitomicaceae bacterium]
MQNKELIISLIEHDLKHHQLVTGLDNIGLEAFDKHLLELFDVIYDLMELPESAESKWGKTYTKYMKLLMLKMKELQIKANFNQKLIL